MKNFALLLLLLSISNTFAQTVSEDILGKWQLQSLEVDGDKATAKETFNTTNVFQLYSENNIFQSTVDDKINKGTWEISDDQKAVHINLDILDKVQKYTITKLTASELELYNSDDGQEIKLFYRKKM